MLIKLVLYIYYIIINDIAYKNYNRSTRNITMILLRGIQMVLHDLSHSPSLIYLSKLFSVFIYFGISIFFLFLIQANTQKRRLCVWSYPIPIVCWCTIRQNFDGRPSCPFIRVLLQELLLKYDGLLPYLYAIFYNFIRNVLYELMWIIYNRRYRDVWLCCRKPAIWGFVTWAPNPWYLWLPKDRSKTIKTPRTN